MIPASPRPPPRSLTPLRCTPGCAASGGASTTTAPMRVPHGGCISLVWRCSRVKAAQSQSPGSVGQRAPAPMPQIASGPVRAGAKATRLVVGARATSVLGGGGSVTPAKRNACDSGGSCCASDRKRRKSNGPMTRPTRARASSTPSPTTAPAPKSLKPSSARTGKRTGERGRRRGGGDGGEWGRHLRLLRLR